MLKSTQVCLTHRSGRFLLSATSRDLTDSKVCLSLTLKQPVPIVKRAQWAGEELLMLYLFWLTVVTKHFLLLLFNHFNFLFTAVSFLPCSAEARTLSAVPLQSPFSQQRGRLGIYICPLSIKAYALSKKLESTKFKLNKTS